MTYANLHKDTNCICLDNSCFQNVTSHWGIKTNKNILRQQDFITKFEKGEPYAPGDCEEICSLKGKSLSIISNGLANNKSEILDIFSGLFKLAPGYKPHLSIIKFKEGLGLFKSSPLPDNKYHHDFYKSDEFTHLDVELIESIPLSTV